MLLLFSLVVGLGCTASYALIDPHVVQDGSCGFGHISNGTHCQECGITEVTPNVKIVGGVEALPSSWPYQVQLRQAIKFDRSLPDVGESTISGAVTCGGTLVNHYTVISAAHCILTYYIESYKNETFFYPIHPNEYYPTWESMFTITLGAHNLDNRSEPSVVRRVSKVIKHPNYNDSNLQNDIAIFILTHPVHYSKYIKPACLPKESDFNYPRPGVAVYAAGWGDTTEGGDDSRKLQNVRLKMYNESFCLLVYPSIEKNWNSQICAGNYSGFQDTCQGDSGGGLYALDSSTELPRFILSGVVSYGVGCARSKLPGIYTRISFYLDWIYKNWVIVQPEDLPPTTTPATTRSTRPTRTVMLSSSGKTTIISFEIVLLSTLFQLLCNCYVTPLNF